MRTISPSPSQGSRVTGSSAESVVLPTRTSPQAQGVFRPVSSTSPQARAATWPGARRTTNATARRRTGTGLMTKGAGSNGYAHPASRLYGRVRQVNQGRDGLLWGGAWRAGMQASGRLAGSAHTLGPGPGGEGYSRIDPRVQGG